MQELLLSLLQTSLSPSKTIHSTHDMVELLCHETSHSLILICAASQHYWPKLSWLQLPCDVVCLKFKLLYRIITCRFQSHLLLRGNIGSGERVLHFKG